MIFGNLALLGSGKGVRKPQLSSSSGQTLQLDSKRDVNMAASGLHSLPFPADSSAAPSDAPIHSDFEFLRLIGTGSFSNVYLARRQSYHPDWGKQVTIEKGADSDTGTEAPSSPDGDVHSLVAVKVLNRTKMKALHSLRPMDYTANDDGIKRVGFGQADAASDLRREAQILQQLGLGLGLGLGLRDGAGGPSRASREPRGGTGTDDEGAQSIREQDEHGSSKHGRRNGVIAEDMLVTVQEVVRGAEDYLCVMEFCAVGSAMTTHRPCSAPGCGAPRTTPAGVAVPKTTIHYMPPAVLSASVAVTEAGSDRTLVYSNEAAKFIATSLSR